MIETILATVFEYECNILRGLYNTNRGKRQRAVLVVQRSVHDTSCVAVLLLLLLLLLLKNLIL